MSSAITKFLLPCILGIAAMYVFYPPAALNIPDSKLIFRSKVKDVRAISISPSSTFVAVGTDRYVEIFNLAEKRSKTRLDLPRTATQLATTRAMAFDPTGRFLASCFSESPGRRVMRIWRTRDWAVVRDIEDYGRGHGCQSFAFSRDGKNLIKVFDRPIGFEGPSIVVYETSSWKEVSSKQTAPFYPADVRVDPCTSVAWIIGDIRNPFTWSRSTPVPTFGTPPMPNSSALIAFDMARGHIQKKIRLPMDVASRSSLSISPDCRSIAIHGISERLRFDLRNNELQTTVYKVAMDQPSYITHTLNGRIIIEGVNAIKLGYLRAVEADSGRALFELRTEAVAADASVDGTTLAVGFENRIEVYDIHAATGAVAPAAPH